GEQRALLLEIEADVVLRVARRVDRAQRDSLGAEHVAGADRRGLELVALVAAGPRVLRDLAGAGALEHRGGAPDVVAVYVRGQEATGPVARVLVGERLLEQRHVAGHARAGVEQERALAATHEIGVRARARERAGVLAAHDHHVRRPAL